MKFLRSILILLAFIPISVLSWSKTIQQSLIDLGKSRDRYSVWFNTIIKNWNTTVEYFEWNWTKKKNKVDDYFIISIKNSKWKIVKKYDVDAPYNLKTYANEKKWEFPESFQWIVNISPSNKYIYFTTSQFERTQWYLMKLSNGSMIYKFDGAWWSRATRTPDKQRFIIWWNLWIWVNDNLWISKKSDITKYRTIKLDGYTRSLIASNDTVRIYINRIKQAEKWEIHIWYAEEYNLDTGKLISSKQVNFSNSWES